MAEESSKDHRGFSRSDLNYDFSSFHKILSTDSEELDCLKSDCGEAFTCRSIPDANENYSSGSTYFVRADQDPRCFLEKLALSIFKFHTKGAAFDQELSGAEWWTQVIDCRDDVGFHWDRDYGLEEERGEHIYPHLATVTYLTDSGGPTVILNRIGTQNKKQCVSGKSDKMVVSRPLVGKHIKFDGRLLHAAPSDLLEEADDDDDDPETNEEDDDDDSDDDKSSVVSGESDSDSSVQEGKVEDKGSDNGESDDDADSAKRVTFLVNIWINHIPMQSKAFPVSRLKNMKSYMSTDNKALGAVLNLQSAKCTSCSEEHCDHFVKELYDCTDSRIVLDGLTHVNIPCIPLETASVSKLEAKEQKLDEEFQERSWKFTSGRKKRCTVTIPLPLTVRFTALLLENDAFLLSYTTSGRCITIESTNMDKRKASIENEHDVLMISGITNGSFELFDESNLKKSKISESLTKNLK